MRRAPLEPELPIDPDAPLAALDDDAGDTEPLRPEEKERERDEKRWEMDPASAPDYQERQRALRTTKRRVR